MSDVSLRDHFQAQCDERMLRLEAAIANERQRLELLEKAINDKFHFIERTTRDTAVSLDKRLDGMNEFRDTLRDQAGKFFTREEHSAYIKVVDADIRSLRESRSKIEGAATQGDLIATQRNVFITSAVAVLSLLVASIGIVIDLLKK
jgi:hypothetical protein